MARLTPRSLPHLPLPWECLRGLSESWPAGITHQTRRTTSGRCSGLARLTCLWLALSTRVRIRAQLVIEVGVEGGQQDANIAGSVGDQDCSTLRTTPRRSARVVAKFTLAVLGGPRSAGVSILRGGRSQSCRRQSCRRMQEVPKESTGVALLALCVATCPGHPQA